MSRGTKIGWLAVLGYVGSIFAANWAISTFGAVPVGFGLMAPAGVFFAGAALSLRDFVQDAWGRRAVVAAIIVGALASAVLGGSLALASGTAFLLSEFADFAVYTPLRERGHWAMAILSSNTVGLLFDSVLFLWLAFHSLKFLPGQVVGKTWVTLGTVALVAVGRSVSARVVTR